MDEDNSTVKTRRHIHDAIDTSYPDVTIGGWVLLMEHIQYRNDDTYYDFEVISSDATGDRDLRPWTARGWCLNAGHRIEYFEYEEGEEE